MKIDINEVKYIANLSKLSFTEEECLNLSQELGEILENFNYLSELDLKIEQEFESEDLKPIVRKDNEKKFECKDLFRNVKSMRGTYIEVPKIIE